MMRMLVAILLGCCFLTCTAVAQQDYLTTYFIQDQVQAPELEQRCKVSLNQNALESHLREVGGPWRSFKPDINWAEDITIIIAPNRTKPGYELAFKNLRWESDKIWEGTRGWVVLHWGWDLVPKQSNGSYSKTVGTQQKPQILIAVVKRYLHKPTNRLICHED